VGVAAAQLALHLSPLASQRAKRRQADRRGAAETSATRRKRVRPTVAGGSSTARMAYDIHASSMSSLVGVGRLRVCDHSRTCAAMAYDAFLSGETFRTANIEVCDRQIALMDCAQIRNGIVAGFTGERARPKSSRASGRSAARGLVSVSGYLVGQTCSREGPYAAGAELQWWVREGYKFYLATERGGRRYEGIPARLCEMLIWPIASPKWGFTDAPIDRTLRPSTIRITSACGPQTIAGAGPSRKASRSTTIWKSSSAKGPAITVPSITLEGGLMPMARAPDASSYVRGSRASMASGHKRRCWSQICLKKRRGGFAEGRVESRPLLLNLTYSPASEGREPCVSSYIKVGQETRTTMRSITRTMAPDRRWSSSTAGL